MYMYMYIYICIFVYTYKIQMCFRFFIFLKDDSLHSAFFLFILLVSHTSSNCFVISPFTRH